MVSDPNGMAGVVISAPDAVMKDRVGGKDLRLHELCICFTKQVNDSLVLLASIYLYQPAGFFSFILDEWNII